jgi:hypothetical protein
MVLGCVWVGNLWRWVWWAMVGDEFTSLRMKLCYSRQLLVTLYWYVLLAPAPTLLYLLKHVHIWWSTWSVAWMELRNKLCTGLTTLQRFYYLNSQCLPSLYHIKLNMVDVMSQLGDIIPIPTMFCFTWKVLFYYYSPIGWLTHCDLGFSLCCWSLLQRSHWNWIYRAGWLWSNMYWR